MLLGDAALIIWNGINAETRQDFFAWHNREHILERVCIPGFRRGRRYIAIEGEPEFFNLYEVNEFETLISGPYPERLANPSHWTERVMPGFLDMNRSLCRVVFSRGLGSGWIIVTVRFTPGDSAMPTESFNRLSDEILAAQPEILALHVCVADLTASSVETAERRARGAPTRAPAAAVLVEATNPEIVRAFCQESLSQPAFQAMGIETEVSLGIYRLEFSLSAGNPVVS